MGGNKKIFAYGWQIVSVIMSVVGLMSLFEHQIRWNESIQNVILSYRELIYPLWTWLLGLVGVQIPEAVQSLVFDLSTIWSVLFVSLNLVALTSEDVEVPWIVFYPRLVRSAFAGRSGIGDLLRGVPIFLFLNLIYLVCLIFPPTFVLISGFIEGRWEEGKVYFYSLVLIVILFIFAIGLNFQID